MATGLTEHDRLQIPFYDEKTASASTLRAMSLLPVERNITKLLANSEAFFEPAMKFASSSWSTKRSIRASEWQVAVLRTSALMESPYEWQVNEPLARLFGFDSDVMLLSLKSGDLSDQENFSDRHRLVSKMVEELFLDRMLCETTSTRALSVFGAEGVIEIISIHGVYAYFGTVSKTANIHKDPPIEDLSQILAKFNAEAIEKEKSQRQGDRLADSSQGTLLN